MRKLLNQKKKNTWLLISLDILLLSTIGILGYRYYKHKPKNEQLSPSSLIISPSNDYSNTKQVFKNDEIPNSIKEKIIESLDQRIIELNITPNEGMTPYRHSSIKTDGEWALLNLISTEINPPADSHMAGFDLMGLVIAKKLPNNTWNISIENYDKYNEFLELVKEIPTNILSDESKSIIYSSH